MEYDYITVADIHIACQAFAFEDYMIYNKLLQRLKVSTEPRLLKPNANKEGNEVS